MALRTFLAIPIVVGVFVAADTIFVVSQIGGGFCFLQSHDVDARLGMTLCAFKRGVLTFKGPSGLGMFKLVTLQPHEVEIFSTVFGVTVLALLGHVFEVKANFVFDEPFNFLVAIEAGLITVGCMTLGALKDAFENLAMALCKLPWT